MTTIIDSAVEKSAASPEALLKAAVSGAKPAESKAAAPVPTAARAVRRFDAVTMGLAGAALAVGTVLGAGTAILATPRPQGTAVVLAEINAALEANRSEASRLAIASDRLDKSVAALKDAADAARSEAKARSAALTEKVGKTESALVAKIAALGERIEQAEKEQGARLAAAAAQAEKRTVASAAPPAPVAKPEPVQTGSIPDAKPKPAVIESWAVRDVYDGTAMLEDRRRRLVEVAIGDAIPGVGRVEAVERRGWEWVVVTRQGLVTPQPW
ncbi:hypothetical protein MKK68_15285 [Methylobacterium sp. E-016]|uniref:hypothetical protein n=1 Tax=Methylobacterium sp. E-016 TaxID=2836556 RepID=UPI001FBC07FB|nr:hypothetical protein [Methylobacterium sp. E-016]MCJ2076998.1 hypothetical protein [Methylobacterium sp. E-016]